MVKIPIIKLYDDSGNSAMIRKREQDQVETLFLSQESAKDLWPILKRFAETGELK